MHKEVIQWWNREEAKSHQLVLLPRDHQKSALIAYRAAHAITNNPAVTIMYLSSTSDLAEKQLGFIKDILDSPIYKRYWPEMLHPEEGKRKKWASNEFCVDHPLRVAEGVRDPTVFTSGLTSSKTGLHCNIAILDDMVVQENAYTRDGRSKVQSQYSLLASIETTGAQEWVVGTRYHAKDLYAKMQEMVAEIVDKSGNLLSQEDIYEVFQREVENVGDGSGEFLWTRQQRSDGKWFGFNAKILAIKRGQYLDRSQFRAQYYNNPNDPDEEFIDSTNFQYYERKRLEKRGAQWHYSGKPLSIFASIDFAFSLRARADYTALVVVGVDSDGNYYVLDIDRFKTNKISEYFSSIFKAHTHWGFKKIRAEVNVAQEAIVTELQTRIRFEGLSFSIDRFRPNRSLGSKEERMESILKPRYENLAIWHYRGGLCQELEDEVRQERPAHDDIKDALANAVDIAVIPRAKKSKEDRQKVVYNTRWGGVQA